MDLVGVRVDVPANTPIVLLRERSDARRLLPIMIGHAEATAIHVVLQGLVPPRPLTHDLMLAVLEQLGATIEQVVITEIRDHTFYAELHLRSAAGESIISARPSDAIALAVRCDAPLFAQEALLDEAGVDDSEMDDVDDEEVDERQAQAILDEFRDFLEDVSPEDFEEPH